MSGPSNPDAAAIADVLAGQTQSFHQIVDRYESALLRVAENRLGRSDLAEEAVQETFLCVFKSLHTYDSRYSFRTWLWTVLLNQCRRHYKKAQNQPKPSSSIATDELAEHPCSGPGPEHAVRSRERAETLERMLSDLPSPQADALRLRFFGELKFQEIADAMGCSLSTAKNRVRDGLLRLSSQLEHNKQLKNSLHGDSP